METIADVIHRGNAPTGVALPLPTLSALRKTGHCSWIGNLHWIIDRINLLSRIINKYFNCPKYLASIWTLFGSIYRVFFGSVLVLWRPSSESESTNCGNMPPAQHPNQLHPTCCKWVASGGSSVELSGWWWWWQLLMLPSALARVD